MRPPFKSVKAADTSRPLRHSVRTREQKKHAVPFGREEQHLGAREDQVSVTMPPKGDDDEPKQG